MSALAVLGAGAWGTAIGVSLGTSFVVALVSIGLIFLYVRLYGEDDVSRRPPRT